MLWRVRERIEGHTCRMNSVAGGTKQSMHIPEREQERLSPYKVQQPDRRPYRIQELRFLPYQRL